MVSLRSMVGRNVGKSKSCKNRNAQNCWNRAISNRKEMVASSRMALGPNRQSGSYLLSFCVSVEHGGIPCIWLLVPRETHVGATKFGWLCDDVSENFENFGIAGCFWHGFCSSMLLPYRLLSNVP